MSILTFLDAVRAVALDRPEAVTTRAAVPIGSSTTWGEPLGGELLGAGAFGQLLERGLVPTEAPFHRVGFGTPTPVQTTRPKGYYVGPGATRPVGNAGFATVSIAPGSAGAMVAVSDELLRSSDARTDAALSRQLASAARSAANAAFLDAMLSGVSPMVPAGLDDGAIFETVDELLAVSDEPVVVAALPLAVRIRAALGPAAELVRVIVAPEAGRQVVALDPYGVAVAVGELSVDRSDVAALELSDGPAQDGSTGVGAGLVSTFQSNLVALRVELACGWERLRADAVRVADFSTLVSS